MFKFSLLWNNRDAIVMPYDETDETVHATEMQLSNRKETLKLLCSLTGKVTLCKWTRPYGFPCGLNGKRTFDGGPTHLDICMGWSAQQESLRDNTGQVD